jgi:hypothetical protein
VQSVDGVCGVQEAKLGAVQERCQPGFRGIEVFVVTEDEFC